MPQTVLFPENNSLLAINLVSSCNNTPWRLPSYWRSHILSALFCHRLHQTFWIWITFRWTHKWIHHPVSCHTFSPCNSLHVQCKEIPIRSPRKPWIIGKSLFILIQGNFVHKIELTVQLYQSAVFRDDIQVLLGRTERGCCNTVLVLGFYINIRIWINSKDRSLFCNTQGFILLHKILDQQNFSPIQLLQRLSFLLNLQRIILWIVLKHNQSIIMIDQNQSICRLLIRNVQYRSISLFKSLDIVKNEILHLLFLYLIKSSSDVDYFIKNLYFYYFFCYKRNLYLEFIKLNL